LPPEEPVAGYNVEGGGAEGVEDVAVELLVFGTVVLAVVLFVLVEEDVVFAGLSTVSRSTALFCEGSSPVALSVIL
jgi:hypothetical protein